MDRKKLDIPAGSGKCICKIICVVVCFVAVFIAFGPAEASLLLLSAVAMFVAACSGPVCKELRSYRRMRVESECRLALIRDCIEMAYTYGYDEKLFYKKFRQAVSFGQLKKRNIVRVESHFKGMKLFPPITRYDKKLSLTRNETEFCWMLSHGFTPRELTVIYGMTNSGSIYVKQSRLHAKLKAGGRSKKQVRSPVGFRADDRSRVASREQVGTVST